MVDRQARKNAYLYAKFRDQQFGLYDKYAKKNGILMKTFLVLNLLYYAKEGLTQREISEQTFQSKQVISLIIKKLNKQGYVITQENPQDKRNKIIKLTKVGREYAERPVRHITLSEDTAMAMFTHEEQEQLINLSRKFTNNLAKLVNDDNLL